MKIALPAALLFLVLQSAFAQTPGYGDSNGTLPSWEERVVAELTNRARVDPATELAACPAGQCLEAACYSATTPVFWTYDLNQSARFHSASMGKFPFFAHDTPCVLFSDIDSRFPGSSDGSFAASCSASGSTAWSTRVGLFGASPYGENIAAGSSYGTPFGAFYAWLYEPTSTSACGYSYSNGHRYNILTSGPGLGAGYAQVDGSPWVNYWTQDFGGAAVSAKIASGSHWTSANHVRDASSGDTNVEFWANWYDTAAPNSAAVVLDGVTRTMTLGRGTAKNGAYSATVTGVSTACHTYYFSFVDSSLTPLRYPATGLLGFGSGCPDYQAGGAAPAVPTGVNAAATSSTGVQVTWIAVAGATSYQIYRRDPGATSFSLRGTSATNLYNDTTASGAAYLYRVRSVNASASSADSAADLATTVAFSDGTLAAGMIVKAAYLLELQTAVNAVRAQALLTPASFTDIAAPGLTIKAAQIAQIRSSLDQAMSALSLTTGGWTDATLTGVPVRAVHFQEIRNRVR